MKVSEHFKNRKPSSVRKAQIRFSKRNDKDSVTVVNLAIGNISRPMYPAMRKALLDLGIKRKSDGVVKYTPTVGTDSARNAFLKILSAEGYDITVADARFAKPIDEDLLLNLYKNHKILFIVEEGSRGGFSSHCLNIITSSDLLNINSKIIRTLNLPDFFQEHASQNEQLKEANLDTNGIYNKIKFDIEAQKIKLNLKINKGYKNN